MSAQLDPQTVLLRFQKLATASSGLIQTDLPQSELGRFADLAMKARSHKIRSVNFVPPLIKPWDYDPTVVTRTVSSTIAASEKAATKARSTQAPKSTATRTGTATKNATSKPATQPGTAVQDPAKATGNAAEGDLSSVCSAAP
ncbi:MAG: hypothetical protein ABJA33_00945 [Pedococcus sp.]